MINFETDYEFREEKKEEFLAALKEHGLFQLTEEGFHYFFKLKRT
jgi:hypothetical protein